VFPVGTYEQLSNRDIQQQIDVNVYQYGMLGKMLMDKLLKRDNKTLLTCIGSYAGFGPLPGLNMYAATKGFVSFFTESLAYEIYGSNLDISTYTPMGIYSNMTKDFAKGDSFFNEDMFNIALTTAVRSHMQELSTPCSRYIGVSCMGYWVHAVITYVVEALKKILPGVFNNIVYEEYQGFRKN